MGNTNDNAKHQQKQKDHKSVTGSKQGTSNETNYNSFSTLRKVLKTFSQSCWNIKAAAIRFIKQCFDISFDIFNYILGIRIHLQAKELFTSFST